MPGNRFDDSFADFDRRAANYYALGFTSHHGADNHYHHLTVRVKGHPNTSCSIGWLRRREHRQPTPALTPHDAGRVHAAEHAADDARRRSAAVPRTHAIVPITAAMNMESLQYITDAAGSRTRLHVYVSVFDEEGRNIKMVKCFADIAVKANESATGRMTVTIPPLMLLKARIAWFVAVRDELTDHVGYDAEDSGCRKPTRRPCHSKRFHHREIYPRKYISRTAPAPRTSIGLRNTRRTILGDP